MFGKLLWFEIFYDENSSIFKFGVTLSRRQKIWLARQCLPIQLNATSDADSRNVFLILK